MKRKNILITAVAVLTTLSLSMTAFAMEVQAPAEETTISEDYIPSETSDQEEEVITLEVVGTDERVKPTTSEEANNYLTLSKQRKELSEKVYESLIELGYDEEHPAVVMVSTEIENAETKCEYYELAKNDLKEQESWATREGEYAVATQVWRYMKELGWSDAVCAGIMGNLMAEVGGQTLNLNYRLYSSDGKFYGMCQWHKGYYGQIHGAGLEAQCRFLKNTIKQELNTYGRLYASGMNYENFLKLTDPADVALCFAKAYERCGSGSY